MLTVRVRGYIQDANKETVICRFQSKGGGREGGKRDRAESVLGKKNSGSLGFPDWLKAWMTLK